MLRHGRVHGLLDQWTAEGLIAPEHLPRLRADVEGAGRLARPATVLAVVAVLLLLAAAISFLATNWEQMPRLLRLILICVAVGGSGAVAVARWRTVPIAQIGHDLAAQIALVMCAGLFGIGLLLVSQMFHFGGNLTTWLAVWSVAAATLALVANTARMTLTLAVVLLSAWGLGPVLQHDFHGTAMGWNALFAVPLASVAVLSVRRGWALELWLAHLGLWLWLYLSVLSNGAAVHFLGGKEAFMLLPFLHGLMWLALLFAPTPGTGQVSGWRWGAAFLRDSQQLAALVVLVGVILVWVTGSMSLEPPAPLAMLMMVVAITAGGLALLYRARQRKFSGAVGLAVAVTILPVPLSWLMTDTSAHAGEAMAWLVLGLGLAVAAGFLGLAVAEGRRGLSGLAVAAFLALTIAGISLAGLGSLFFLIVGCGLAILAVLLARKSRRQAPAGDTE